MDESPKQMIEQNHQVIPMKVSCPTREDYEYEQEWSSEYFYSQ